MADPNILMGIKTAQFMNPLDAAAQAAQVKRANLQNAMFQQETDMQTKLDRAYQLAGGDINKMDTSGVDFNTRFKIEQLKSDQQKTAAQAKQADALEAKNRIEAASAKLTYGGQLLSGATPENWQQVRKEFFDTTGGDLGESYDPIKVRTYIAQGQSLEKQLANQYRQMGFEEDVRHHRAMESNAAARGDGGDKTKYTIIYDAQGNAYTKNVNAPDEPPIPMMMPDSGTMPPGQPAPTGTPAQQPPASFRKAVAQPSQKAFTLDQSNSATYGLRAQQADEALSGVGTDYSPVSIAAKRGAGNIPLVGGAAEMAANAKLTPKEQQVDQAQLNFLMAVLRKESGATIAPSEIATGTKQYFAQPGDSPDVLAQKAQNRETAIAGLKNSAGPAWMEGSAPPPASRQVVRTGTVNGRKVVQYSDGTKEYAE